MQRYSDWFPIIISYRSNMSVEIPKTISNNLIHQLSTSKPDQVLDKPSNQEP